MDNETRVKQTTTSEAPGERTTVTETGQPVANTVAQADRTVEKADSATVAARVVWYIAGFIIILLALRIVFLLLGASQASGITGFIYTVSGVFAAPFTGIFPTPANGVNAFDTASLVAIVIYALAAWGIAKLFTLNKAHREA